MPAVLKCHCHGIIFSWNTGNLLSAGKIPEKNIKQQFRMITGIIILHGILSRRMEMSGRIIQPHIIYSYSAVLCFFGIYRSVMPGFTCQMPAILHKRGTSDPPAFKSGFFRFYVPLCGLP